MDLRLSILRSQRKLVHHDILESRSQLYSISISFCSIQGLSTNFKLWDTLLLRSPSSHLFPSSLLSQLCDIFPRLTKLSRPIEVSFQAFQSVSSAAARLLFLTEIHLPASSDGKLFSLSLFSCQKLMLHRCTVRSNLVFLT